MKRLSVSRPLLIGLVATLVVVGAWYELLWSPQSKSLASNRRREQDASSAYIVASQRLGHLKRQESRADQMNQLSARLDSAVPSHDDLDGLITGLNDYAQKAGVGLTSLSVVQPSGVAKAPVNNGSIPVQMSVSGGYFAIHHFLDEVRDGSRLVVVDTVALSAGSAGAGGTGSRSGDGTALTAAVGARFFVTPGALTTSPNASGVSTGAGAGSQPGGTGSLQLPINKARSAVTGANAASANAGSQSTTGSGTP